MMTPPLTAGERTHGDFDGGPTKRWFAEVQGYAPYARYVEWAWGKRPAEELYDLREDRDQVNNLIDSPLHATVREDLAARLMRVLNETGDPRVVGDGGAFDAAPYRTEKSPLRRPKL